ncbi:MAG: hypothetical protein J6P05_03850 [Lachnospiraceae bacterium]|nr:hypothetical protein [Lachnospiraceae bacterium]
MATSSIIENIRVNNPKVLEEYVDAMERIGKDVHPRTDDEKTGVIDDKVRIRAFMTKVLAREGTKA